MKLHLGIGIGLSNPRRAAPVPSETVPGAVLNWTLTNLGTGTSVRITVLEPPEDDGGSIITDYEYRVDGGSWVSMGSADIPVSVDLTGLTEDVEIEVEVMAINAIGAGDLGSAQQITPAVAALDTPELYELDFDGENGDLSFSMDPSSLPATVYYLIGDDDTRTLAQIKAGTGADLFDSFEIVTGSESLNIDISTLPLETTKYLHIVGENVTTSGAIQTVQFERTPGAFLFEDDFNDRTEALADGADWTDGPVIDNGTHNRVFLVSGGEAGFDRISGTEWASAFTAEEQAATSRHQFVRVTVTSIGNQHQLFVRTSADGSQGYFGRINNDGHATIFKFSGYPGSGSVTSIVTDTGFGLPSLPFDMQFEVDSDQLRLYVGNMETPAVSVTDTDITGAGRQGFRCSIGTGRLSDRAAISNFRSGNL
jgi:hypothetical protein